MKWLENYHEDHMMVLRLLAKLQGNLKEIASGEVRPHVHIELQEFADVIEKVIRPHFHQEEKGIYARIKDVGEEEKNFINRMLAEHEKLYQVFDIYIEAIKPLDPERLIESGETITDLLAKHIHKEEKVVPNIAKKLGIQYS